MALWAITPPIAARSRGNSLITHMDCLRSSMIWVRASADDGMDCDAMRSSWDDMI